MKKVIFEQPADTIPYEDLRLTDFIGVQIQNTKAFLIKDEDVFTPVLKSLNTASEIYDFQAKDGQAGLKKFTHVYKFDTLTELFEWLVQ